MITRNFNLNLYAGNSSPLVINVNQYDKGEQWVFTLYDENGVQYIPSTGAIVGIKSDGLGIINTGSVVDGKVVINETQQMTAAIGKATFELTIDSQTHGTANFVVLVEPKPGDNASLSESDLSLIQEALNATSPLPTGGTVGQVLTKTANGSAWSDAGTPTQEQVAEAVSDWADENITVTTGVVIDTSLAVAGAAADSAKVGQELSDLKSEIAQGSGLTDSIKIALMDVVDHIGAWTDGNANVYKENLRSALYPPVGLSSISAVYTQSGAVYDTDSLDDLKTDLVVTAHYDNSTSETVSSYTLSGVLTEGTSTVTVSYGGKTTTFNVVVSSSARLDFEFEAGYSVGVNTNTNMASKTATTARATTATPIPNLGYVFTSTDPTKYQVNAIDVTEFKQPYNNGYKTGGKTITWGESDSAKTAFVWLALKKLDGTDFTAEELANGASAVFTFTHNKFGTFADGYTAIRTAGGEAINYRQATTARATTTLPVINNNYVVTVTDSSKYNVLIQGVQNLEKVTSGNSVDTYGFTSADSTSKSWATQDSSDAPYIWICLKKMDGTAFTDEELANNASAVFTYTEG